MKNFYPKKNNGVVMDFLKKRGFVMTLMVSLAAVSAIGFLSVKNMTDKVPDNVWEDTAQNNKNNLLNGLFSQPEEDTTNDTGTTSKPENQNATKSETAPANSKTKDTAVNAPVEVIKYALPLEGDITAVFSIDAPVFSKTMNDYRAHTGIDIKGNKGDNIKSSAAGVVENVYIDELRGNTVEIRHPDTVLTIYSGLESLDSVKTGDSIKAGDIIGKLGNSPEFEAAEEPHLHFEMLKNGVYLNPAEMMK